MLRRATRALIAFLVALGLTMPAGVRAMPMSGDMMGHAFDQPCQDCPQHHQNGGSTTLDKMLGCQALACVSASAVLPSSVLLPARALFGTAYVSPEATPLAGAEPVPNPFPPRPIVLL